MALRDEIISVNSGAEFFRADMHIHSYGTKGSHDVSDEKMTPAEIVKIGQTEKVKIISLTDHNSIGNVEEAVSLGEKAGILVIPGIEVATAQGHLLAYFSQYNKLERFFGRLNLTSDRKLCNDTIPQCLQYAQEFGGIGVAAHIELDSGFEKKVPGYTPIKEEILRCHNLVALEITHIENQNQYSEKDTDSNRKRLFESRKQALGFSGQDYELAKVLNSDAHTQNALFKNANGNRKLTRYKMNELTFDAFRIAILDPIGRVRLEDSVPAAIPRFVGMKLEGGFLAGQTVHFSKNLTCVIGGRGTGKSTFIESLRAAAGHPAKESLLDTDVWPDRISLVYQDETGREQILTKGKYEQVQNPTNPSGITFLPIEGYGQGETAESMQNSGKNPKVMLNFLDGFCDLEGLSIEDGTTREHLFQNQSKIDKLNLETKTISDFEKAKNNTELQLKTLKDQNAASLVELEEALAKERLFRQNLIADLKNLVTSIRKSLSDKTLFSTVADLEDTSLVIGKDEFSKVKNIVSAFAVKIGESSKDLNSISDSTVKEMVRELEAWTKKEGDAQAKIEKIRKDLDTKGIKLDLAFIRKVTKDAADYSTKLKDLKKKVLELKEARNERKKLVEQRKTIKGDMYKRRFELATRLNESLRATITDFQVTIRFHEGRLSSQFQQALKDINGWRTAQVPKAETISANIGVYEFIDSVKNKNANRLLAIKDNLGNPILSVSEVNSILEKCSSDEAMFRLESCEFEDLPDVFISKNIKKADGTTENRRFEFSRLSLGQQQAILLTILLYSKSKCPLVIDQSEDNLDGEFIYRTVVKNLRQIKEYRQVIVVTHNANIAVLGDADLILPLRSTSEKSQILDPGSIDNAKTRKMACTILEGSEQAFKQRQKIYGF